MTQIFADTFYFLALLNPSDDSYDAAFAFAASVRKTSLKLSEAIREIIRLGNPSRAYWDRELPKRHPLTR